MTSDERWNFDLYAMQIFGFDSDEVDNALQRAGHNPDDKTSYSWDDARHACREEAAHRRMVSDLNKIIES